jgi:hypothetical protein
VRLRPSCRLQILGIPSPADHFASLSEDGKEMKFDCENTNIKGLVIEVDRHSRILQKAQDLSDS